MPLPIITDVFRVVLTWQETVTGLHAHNVFHVSTVSGGKTGQQVYTCINSHVAAGMWTWANVNAKVYTVAVTPLDGTSAAVINSTGTPAKWTGSSGGTALPQVAGEVSMYTALRGPAHRGRIFVPFIGESEVTGNVLIDVATVTAAWGTFNAAVLADATTPLFMVVASYKNASAQAITNFVGRDLTYTVGKRNPH